MQYTLPLEPIFKKVVKRDGMVFLLVKTSTKEKLEKHLRSIALNDELVLGFADPSDMRTFNNRNYLQYRTDVNYYLYNLMHCGKENASIYLVFRSEHDSVLFKLKAESLDL